MWNFAKIRSNQSLEKLLKLKIIKKIDQSSFAPSNQDVRFETPRFRRRTSGGKYVTAKRGDRGRRWKISLIKKESPRFFYSRYVLRFHARGMSHEQVGSLNDSRESEKRLGPISGSLVWKRRGVLSSCARVSPPPPLPPIWERATCSMSDAIQID